MKQWIILTILLGSTISSSWADTGPEPEGECDHDDYIYKEMIYPPHIEAGSEIIDTKCRGEYATITVPFVPHPGEAVFVCPKTGKEENRDVPCTQVNPWIGHVDIGDYDKTVQWGGFKDWGWVDPGGGWHPETLEFGDTFVTEDCDDPPPPPDPDPDPDPNPNPPPPDPGDEDPPSTEEECAEPGFPNIGITELSHPNDAVVYLRFPKHTNVVNVGGFISIVQRIVTINTPEERDLYGHMRLKAIGGNTACVQVRHEGQPYTLDTPFQVVNTGHEGCGIHTWHGHSEWFEFIPKQYGEVIFETEVDPDPDVSGNGQPGQMATFRVVVPKVDLIIHSAQNGTGVIEQKEEKVGAFTVANLNDTDGDGTVDKDDNSVTASSNGRDEVDLMKLEIQSVIPTLPGETNKLKLTVSGDVKLWNNPTKGSEVQLFNGQKEYSLNELPKIVWIEARSPSASLRDIVIEGDFMGAIDTVQATAIWAMPTDTRHNFGEWVWNDFTDPPNEVFQTLGTFGLRPITSNGGLYPVFNVIGVQFEITPDKVWEESNVKFDITRQMEKRYWKWIEIWGDTNSPLWSLYQSANFPSKDEMPNDDSIETYDFDESSSPNNQGHMYSLDAPVDYNLNALTVIRHNMREFIRVSFDGILPQDNIVSGSRCSDKHLWHSRHRIGINDATQIPYRTTGDSPETDVNDIAEGHFNDPNALPSPP